MNSKKKLDSYSLLIVSKYFTQQCDFINVICVCKKFKDTIDKFRFNPIPVKNTDLFQLMQTQYLYYPFEKKIENEDLLFNYQYSISYEEKLKLESENERIKTHHIVYNQQDCAKYGITLPQCVNIIGSNCFEDYALEMIEYTIPDHITQLKNNTFENLRDLTSLTFNKLIKELPFACCLNCFTLESIEIPSNITKLNVGCFFNCLSLTKVSLPSTLVVMENQCFSFCRRLQTIVLPSNIHVIPYRSFIGCTSLTHVEFQGDIHSFHKECFKDCISLSKIDIPSTTTSINDFAFANCTSLKEYVLPSNISFVKYGAIEGCLSITKLVVPTEQNNVYPHEITDREVGIFLKFGYEPIGIYYNANNYRRNTIICPRKPFYLTKKSFAEKNITTFVIPSSIIHIDEECFSDCNQLTSLYVPNTVTNIQPLFLSNCMNLKYVHLDTYSLHVLQDKMFYNCKNLEYIQIPSSVTKISTNVFENCESLTELIIPSSVIKIKQNAFKNCKKLERLIIPTSVTKIESGIITGCTSLTQLEIPCNEQKEFMFNVTLDDANIIKKFGISCKHYVIVERMTNEIFEQLKTFPSDYQVTIEKDVFDKSFSKECLELPLCIVELKSLACSTNESIEIIVPSTVTSIGDCCFSNCKNLKRIHLPLQCEYGRFVFEDTYDLEHIYYEGIYPGKVSCQEAYVFQCCGIECSRISITESDKNYHIPMNNTIKEIVYSYDKTETFDVPSYITKIGKNVFFANIVIDHLNLPSSIQSIGSRCFSDVSSLKSLNSSHLTKISSGCFTNCLQLERVTLTTHLKEIRNTTFSYCNSLKSIYIPSSVSKISWLPFYFCVSLEEIIFDPNCEIPEIDSVFAYKCRSLKKIILPKIKSIDNLAFFKNLALKKIEIPSTCTYLGMNVFKRCYQLTSIILHDGLQIIDKECFMYCVSLEHITIPNTVTSIRGNCFSECSQLSSISLSSSLKHIEYNCFYNCKKLKTILIDNQPITEYPYPISYQQSLLLEKNNIHCKHVVYTNEDHMNIMIPQCVSELSDCCFAERIDIRDICIEDNIKRIGKFCFSGCSELVAVMILSDNIFIDDCAFDNCPNLSIITVKKGTRFSKYALPQNKNIIISEI